MEMASGMPVGAEQALLPVVGIQFNYFHYFETSSRFKEIIKKLSRFYTIN